MPIEEKLKNAKNEIERAIKLALINENMTQTDLAKLIGENKIQVNQAIKGNTNPRAVEVRKKIYKVLGMD